MFYNGKSGWLVAGLKSYRKTHNVRERRNALVNDDGDNDIEEDENWEEKAKADVDELRTTVVTEANTGHMTALLRRTLKYRLKLMNSPATDLFRIFPYFFAHPQLVILIK